MKKVLIIGEKLSSNFYFELVEEVFEKIPDCHISVLAVPEVNSTVDNRKAELVRHGCTVNYYYDKALLQKRERIYRFWRGVKRILAHFRVKSYDMVVISSVSFFSFLTAFAASKDTRIITVFWGSDLLRAKKSALLLMRPLLRRADAVVLSTRYFADRFSEIFNSRYDDRVIIVDFGTRNADILHVFARSHTKEECKKAYGLPTDKLCIFCGYNGFRAHRHKEIFHLLETLPNKHKSSICLVFHCAYALDDSYKSELESLFSKSDIDCRLFTDFLAGDDLAALRMCADVMLNLQPTDALSSSMLESLEAGAIVIKGDWLVYPELEAGGAYLLSIPSMDALPELIQDIVENPISYQEKTKPNRGVVLMQSWDTVRGGWMKALGVNEWTD